MPGIPADHQLRHYTVKFAGMCKARIPDWLAELFEGLDDDPATRQAVAAADGRRRAVPACCRTRVIDEFHIYTLNRAELTLALCTMLGVRAETAARPPVRYSCPSPRSECFFCRPQGGDSRRRCPTPGAGRFRSQITPIRRHPPGGGRRRETRMTANDRFQDGPLPAAPAAARPWRGGRLPRSASWCSTARWGR